MGGEGGGGRACVCVRVCGNSTDYIGCKMVIPCYTNWGAPPSRRYGVLTKHRRGTEFSWTHYIQQPLNPQLPFPHWRSLVLNVGNGWVAGGMIRLLIVIMDHSLISC